jgi:hypothetical protein
MFKKLAMAAALFLAAIPFVRAQSADEGKPGYVGNTVAYESYVETRNAGNGFYTHFLKISLYNNNDPNVEISHIICNGENVGKWMRITDRNWKYITYMDNESRADWTWQAGYE